MVDEARLQETFLDLVRISSPSRHEAGVAAYVTRALADVGCEVRDDGTATQTGSDTGNIVATLPGTAPGHVCLTAHMDTVEPCGNVEPHIADGVVYSDGTTVLGGDDKVGIASAIETVRCLAESNLPHPTVTCVFTVQEEIGLNGAKAFADDFFDGALALVCDGDTPPGSIVCGAPYHYTFTAVFTGRAAHAGVAPEKGISAVAMASRAIARMELGKLGEHEVCNIGTISGGSANNVVPASCTVTGECRALDADAVERVRGRMQQAMDDAAAEMGGSVDARWVLEYPGFHFGGDDYAVRLAEKAAARVSLPFSAELSLGGTDANVFAGKGAHCLILGTGMTDFHTTSESLALADLNNTARYLIAICQEAADRLAAAR